MDDGLYGEFSKVNRSSASLMSTRVWSLIAAVVASAHIFSFLVVINDKC